MVRERVTCDGRSAGRSIREDSAVIQRWYWCEMKSICAVAGIISNSFNNWRREVAKLGGFTHCYDWSGCMKYWEVGACFRSSLLGSYCGGGHGRVIGVFVRRAESTVDGRYGTIR